MKKQGIHNSLKNQSDNLARILLSIIGYVLGFISFWGPLFVIWGSVADGEFSILRSMIAVIIGIVLFYLGLSLSDISDVITKYDEIRKNRTLKS